MGDRKRKLVAQAKRGQGVDQRRRLAAEFDSHSTPARFALKGKEQLGARRVRGLYASDIHGNRAPFDQGSRQQPMDALHILDFQAGFQLQHMARLAIGTTAALTVGTNGFTAGTAGFTAGAAGFTAGSALVAEAAARFGCARVEDLRFLVDLVVVMIKPPWRRPTYWR
jgi:hypothetical protein